jgi:copper chaperone CopZ
MTEIHTEQTARYLVPGMTCDHCKLSISEEVGALAGVRAVEVDLDSKLVTVHAQGFDDPGIRAAINEAGYEAEVA